MVLKVWQKCLNCSKNENGCWWYVSGRKIYQPESAIGGRITVISGDIASICDPFETMYLEINQRN